MAPRLNPNQQGFIPGRSLWDNYLEVQATLMSKHKDSNGYLAFLDMEKAYDRVNWSYLRLSLERFHIPSLMLSSIMIMYQSIFTRVLSPMSFTNRVIVEQGLRQGDPLSQFFSILL